MNKEEKLYDIILKEGSITSKRATELGYPRIYLTFLVKNGKIFKVDRGVYSCNKDLTLNPLVSFQKHNRKVIFSCFSALNLLAFYAYVPEKINISVPQGYNASRYDNVEVFYNNETNYSVGTTYISLNEEKIIVYNLERSICDIIKEHNRFDKRLYNKLINYYFSREDINYKKLLEYSKLLKVSNRVQEYLSLFKA